MKNNRFWFLFLLLLSVFFQPACRSEKEQSEQDVLSRWPDLRIYIKMILPETPYAEIEDLERRAAQGDAEASALLIQAHVRGDITRKDPVRAIEALERAIPSGHPLAMYYNAYHMENGIDGTPRDTENAKEKWQEALTALEALEDPSGHELDALCMIYASGRTGEKDLLKAWELCERACQFDLPQPWARKAWFYEEGNAPDGPSLKNAFECYVRAAQLGSSLANHHLARCYLQGVSGEKNREMALGYLARAAQKGVVNARTDLQRLLDEGENFIGGQAPRQLLSSGKKFTFRFEIGDMVEVVIAEQLGSSWHGTIIDRKKEKYKVRVRSLQPNQGTGALLPCPCTGQEVLSSGGEVRHVWIPEECVTKKNNPDS